MTNEIAEEHGRRNGSTRDRWEPMAHHRDHLTRLLVSAASQLNSANDQPSLGVLGAGNCNDLELPQLLQAFREITLFDLDEEALQRGLETQSIEGDSRIERRGGIELTGIFERLEQHRQHEPPVPDDQVAATMMQASAAPAPAAASFDVVCSSCLLTQLVDSVVLALGETHPRLVELVLAVRDRHLAMVVEMVRPGGLAILVSDFVSSATLPALAALNDQQIQAAAQQWLEQGNFFTGANPFVVLQKLQSHSKTDKVQLLSPWRWDIGNKQFAVFACVATIA